MTPIEEMSAFFTARVNVYDEHMLTEVAGCRDGYALMARLLPAGVRTLLDLGCGTGLELDAIFQVHSNVTVTGIDVTQAMLDVLRAKHPDKHMHLIHGDYFAVPLGDALFDAAVSFQSLHHFTPERKRELFGRLFAALKEGATYLECDYMAPDRETEGRLLAECERLRARAGLADGVLVHFDTPLAIDHEVALLREAGFSSVEKVWQVANSVMLVAVK